MQVKKFEARTMKDALEMVKSQLGPDAIILSARDHSKKFGLVGQGSVEITAAVPEDKLHQKKFAESKMRQEDRDRLNRSPARVQKQFINQAVTSYLEENKPRPQMTRTRYAEIEDEQMEEYRENADVRIKSAVSRAWNAMQAHGSWREADLLSQAALQAPVPAPTPKINPAQFAATQAAAATAAAPAPPMAVQKPSGLELKEIQDLKSELATLKKTLEHFQKIPQSWSTSFPGSEYQLPYDVSASFEKLVEAGITPDFSAEILREAQSQMSPVRLKNKALVNGFVAKRILENTQVVQEGEGATVQIFMGPKGGGKTSALVKLASQYVIAYKKKVMIVSTDTHKVGAVEQLRIFSQILNVPFLTLRSTADWRTLLQRASGYDYILCDFPGMSLRDENDFQSIRSFLPPSETAFTTHLVLSVTSKDGDLQEIGKRYSKIGFNDVIFTALDESFQHGSIYNFMKTFKVPLHSFGIGAKIPEDFEWATKERMLDLIFKLSKVQKTGVSA